MNDVRFRIPGVFFVLAALAIEFQARPALCQSSTEAFGLGDQVLNVGAAAFQPSSSFADFNYAGGGYLFSAGTIGLLAPLTMPTGAQIFSICLYGYDANPNSTISVSLVALELAPGGPFPGVVEIKDLSNDFDSGYGMTCGDVDPPHTFRDVVDVDGDSIPEDVVHVLRVLKGEGSGLGGVRIFWRGR